MSNAPTDEEIEAVAEALGVSFDAAKAICAGATLASTQTADGHVVDA